MLDNGAFAWNGELEYLSGTKNYSDMTFATTAQFLHHLWQSGKVMAFYFNHPQPFFKKGIAESFDR